MTTSAPFTQESRPSPNDEIDDDEPPARPPAPPAVPDLTSQRPTPLSPSPPTRPQLPPASPRASAVRPTSLSPLASQDDDQDENDWDPESDDEEGRRVAALSSQVDDPSQLALASQDSRLSVIGAAAVDGPGAIDVSAIRARVREAQPARPFVAPPLPPLLRKISCRDPNWWRNAKQLRITGSEERRETLNELDADLSWLDDKAQYYDPDIQRLNCEHYDIILLDRAGSLAYQEHFEDSSHNFSRTELERKHGHTVVRNPCVVAFSTDNGEPLETFEVVAVVAINTATTRAAWDPATVAGTEELLRTMPRHHNPAKRGSNTQGGGMYMIGAPVRRWTDDDLKKRNKGGRGRIDTYRTNNAAAAESNYYGYINPLGTLLAIMAALEAAVSPRLHRARLAVSAAINAPAIVGGISREDAPSVTLACSRATCRRCTWTARASGPGIRSPGRRIGRLCRIGPSRSPARGCSSTCQARAASTSR